MCATWDDFEAIGSEDDLDNEEAMVCFMAMKDNKDEDSDQDVMTATSHMMICFTLFKKCTHMQKLLQKNNSLKDDCIMLSKKNEELICEKPIKRES